MIDSQTELTNAEPSIFTRDEGLITPAEVAYVEDLQEVAQAYTRRLRSHEEADLSSPDAVNGWAFDLVEQLNDGSLTVDGLKTQFRVSQQGRRFVFKPVGGYTLEVEQDDATQRWVYAVTEE